MKNRYLNSWPLDVYKVSDFPEVKGLASVLYDELMQKKPPMYKKVPDKTRVRSHIQLVILNLYDAYLFDPTKYIGYSRDENDYKINSRYNKLHISYEILIHVVDHLEKLDYLNHKIGFFDKEKQTGLQSRIRIKTKLIKAIENNLITKHMIQEQPERIELEETIILRDLKGKEIDYQDTDEIEEMRENLNIINRVLREAFIGLYIKDEEFHELNKRLTNDPAPDRQPINFQAKRLRRIFNRKNDFSLGGRFYGGWWQNIPKEYRKFIRIVFGPPNYLDVLDKEVVEVDYDAMHARILYWQELRKDWGDEDPFSVEDDPDLRNLFKNAFYIAVNAETPEKAQKALQKKLNFGQLPDLGFDGKQLFQMVQKQHKEIADCFGSGKGLELQRIDSDIAEIVMMQMLAVERVMVLPMHDSFITPSETFFTLASLMPAAFKKIVGIPCPVSPKCTIGDLRYEFECDDKIVVPGTGIKRAKVRNLENAPEFPKYATERDEYSIYYGIWDAMQIRLNKAA